MQKKRLKMTGKQWNLIWREFNKKHNKTGARWKTQRKWIRQLVETQLKGKK